MREKRLFLVWPSCLLLLWIASTSNAATVVTGIEPRYGSLNGETRITISGTGFAANNFNFGAGNSNLGNTVDLVSSTTTYSCRIHPDGCHETQVTCYTPPIPEGDYEVRVSVDGTAVAASQHCSGNTAACTFRAQADSTPTISDISPRSGPPGTLVTMSGKLFTNRYGSNVATSDNGKTEKLLRIYVGSQNCEAKVMDTDILYGITLNNNGTSNWGTLKCKVNETYISYRNASFIVEGAYGRSQPDHSLLRVGATDQIHMFQIYSVIQGISPQTGSTSGGTRITISVNYFDETDAPVSVKVGGTDCRVVEKVTDSHIVCETAPQPPAASIYQGNRGLLHEMWSSTSLTRANLADVATLTSSAADYNATRLDEFYFRDESYDNFVSRTSGFFVSPKSGKFHFYIKGDDNAVLYMSPDSDPANKVEIASTNVASNYFRFPSQESSEMTLTAGNSYYMEVHHREGTGSAHFQVAARFFETTFTSKMTGAAWSETQSLVFNSTVTQEVQSFTVQQRTVTTPTSEVQAVTVTGSSDAKFRLCLHGVCTSALTSGSLQAEVQSALGELPSIQPDSVSVSSTQVTGGYRHQVTIESSRGDLPDLTYKFVNGSTGVTVSVTEVTAGQPSYGVFSVAMNGVPSPPLPASGTASQVKAGILELFSVRCPNFLKRPSDKKYDQDYESSFTTYNRNFGERTSETEPLCGRYSAKNPQYIYYKGNDDQVVGLDIFQYKWLCFGYMGPLSRVYFRYSYVSSSGDKSAGTWYFDTTASPANTWAYQCTNLYEIATSRASGGSAFRVDWVTVTKSSSDTDLYMDTVVLVRNPTTTFPEDIDDLRMRPPRPNNALIRDVTVTGSGGSYSVSLDPYDCAHNFPLFTQAYGPTVTVTRTTAASPGIGGTFRVSYKGRTSQSVPPNILEASLKSELAAVGTIGETEVVRSGDCANFAYQVTFLSLAGDQPEMTIDGGSLTGPGVGTSVVTERNGSLWYDPIPGDMLRSRHAAPQVSLLVNHLAAACGLPDCSFLWSAQATPTLAAVSPSQGSQGATVTITGSGFDSNPDNNNVTIGGVTCNVTSATTTQITCILGNGPTGRHDVKVNILGQGFAGGSVTFNYTSDISSISPTSGSIGGGTTLVISGYGFTSDAAVTVGGSACVTSAVAQSSITCTTPPAASVSGGLVDVIVTQVGASLTSSTQFNYDASSTPIISSIDVTTSSVEGGATITIGGSGFGASANPSSPLSLGGQSLSISSYSDSQIVATLPSLPPGAYPLKLVVTGKGEADLRTNSIPSITYTLSVTNISPERGSVYGGTRVTISGAGFSTNTSLIDVTLGSHACTVESATTSQIVCLVADTASEVKVDNQGSHPSFGKGYAWNPAVVEVKAGDKVKFQWTTPSFVSGIGYRVFQTRNASTELAKGNGFVSSSAKSANGAYIYRFTVNGDYFFSSGHPDDYDVIPTLKGKVTVVSRPSEAAMLKVKVAGHEANYQPGGSAPSSSGACPGTTSAISGCSDPEPSGSDASKFYFKFWTCVSPTVTDFSPREATTFDDVTVTGTGFTSTTCENEVTLGDASTVVSSSSATSLTLKAATTSDPAIATPQEVTMRVGNRGYALVALTGDLSRRFVLLPMVDSVTPTSGSLSGGTQLTIRGSGFKGSVADMSVTVGGLACRVTAASYTQLLCLTPARGSAATEEVAVSVYSGGSHVTAACKAPPCQFSFSQAATPTASAVSPTTVSGASNTLTITGTKFGSSQSDVTVVVGGASCSVSGVTDTSITCTVGGVPAGTHPLEVYVSGLGLASTTATVSSAATIASLSPNTGSTFGGAILTISGNGFSSDVSVLVDGLNCTVIGVTSAQVTCRLPAHAAGAVSVAVTSNGQSYPSQTFTYDAASTPTVTAVNPPQDLAGSSVTITGTGFSGNNAENDVMIGSVTCTVTSSSTTSITCTLGNAATGSHPVTVNVAGKGLTDSNVAFTYNMVASSINPKTGSTAGGQTVTLAGSGFIPNNTAVTVGGSPCPVVYSATQSSTQVVCKTPGKTGVTGTQAVDVVVTVNGVSSTMTSAYTYDASITPEVTGVSPARGGTAGGTTLTITGTGFNTNNPSDVTVTVGGARCAVTSASNTQVLCVTGAAASQRTKVSLEVAGNGIATQTSADFFYIDVWSSRYTWGNQDPPAAGEMVVIPRSQIILLDTSTPVLKMLLIQGGQVIFDEQDIELQAENILITDGGLLQVGTEAAPFQHKATITLHGHFRSQELPIYGAKTLAVREGTLDLHGRPTHVTWTLLDSTANAGDTQITLTTPVEWQVGDQIVLPTTGHRHTQIQNEVRTITAISGDKRTLTLDAALTYKHVAISGTWGGVAMEFRGEVGLLSHNVLVRGSRDSAWDTAIKACPAGFDTGEFKTQTCFLGRFGDETGTDQFGGQIMVHAPRPDQQLAVARLEYVELTHMGQAFRMGRYPIHFHINGDMSASYVRGCAIHRSYNRAVNVHGTSNTLVEHTVLYDVMGGAFFLEDGIETGNTFQYNLGIFVRASSSLRNDDITPATFWVTNPNNTIQHNHAAGGTHFGFWYRMHTHPEGPSFTTSVCPKHVPLGVFRNNTAHSFGWFGLWIFEDYFPKVDGSCSSSAANEPAVFETLHAWNNEKGAETVNTGALQFHDFVLANNELAGWEGKQLSKVDPFDEVKGPMVKGGSIVGRVNGLDFESGSCTKAAIVIPYQNGLLVKDVHFVNFDQGSCAVFAWTRIQGTCTVDCGGFTTKTSGLQFTSADQRVFYAWEYEGLVRDLDGSLTGTNGGSVVPTTAINPPSCTTDARMSVGVSGSVCPASVHFHRFAFNNIKPSSLEFKRVIVNNSNGASYGNYQGKRISHKPGWMVLLPDAEHYRITFENGEHLTNISYTGVFYDFQPGHWITVKHKADRPDRFMIDGSTAINETVGAINPATDKDGAWKYEDNTQELQFLVSATKRSRKKRGVITYDEDRSYSLRSFQCYYTGCTPPPDPKDVLERPDSATKWSWAQTWSRLNRSKPIDGDDLTIPRDTWIAVDEDISSICFGTLEIEGGLEFDPSVTPNTLCATYVIVKGRLVAGWDQQRAYNGSLTILLKGEHSTQAYSVNDGPELGSKVIGVYGGLDLHGMDVGIPYTRLAVTAAAGANQLVLEQPVPLWDVGSEVVVTTTSMSAWHTEVARISAKSGDSLTLTLNKTLAHRHLVHTETLNTGQTIKMAAYVGLLTRNIKIVGHHHPNLFSESFGARVVVARTADAARSYSGLAKLANVEWWRAGQEGWTEDYDPRFPLAFVNVQNDVTGSLHSYVRSCSFHHSFSSAIGVFGTADLEISNNVIYNVVGGGIVTSSDKTNLVGNLISLVQHTGVYQERNEESNFRQQGGIDAPTATNLILRDNVVAGSERTGYTVRGQPCTGNSVPTWSGNEVIGALNGVGVWPALPAPTLEMVPADPTCVTFENFRVYKCQDFGLYVNTNAGIRVKNLVSVENRVGVLATVFGASATGHVVGTKFIEVRDSLFVGSTSSLDCAVDRMDSTDQNILNSGHGRSWGNGTNGCAGLALGQFHSGGNNAAMKPFKGIMSYNAIAGLLTSDNNTFAHFGPVCSGSYCYAVTTNPSNDDGQHPIHMTNTHLDDVAVDQKIFFHEPNVGKINPSDCVDMDCDGLKKSLVRDDDGSFLGRVGAVVPWSEYQWNGDPRRGLGDYRIPRVLLTDLQGNRLAVNSVAPHKGIVRSSQCQFRHFWRAYDCPDLSYRLLVIESMDSDTETRRLSPVAVLSDGYLDLINGPQDHGWCSGYTCRKRLSTFFALTAMNKTYDIYFTSTTPQTLRFHLLNAQSDDGIRVGVWYARPFRLDVYVNGNWLLPKNGEMKNNKFFLKTPFGCQNSYMPQPSDIHGSNCLDREQKMLYFTVKGSTLLELRTAPVIVVSYTLPAMTVDEFFGENLVNNLAAFLNVPPAKVRIVNVVNEQTGQAGRRRRSTGTTTIYVEVGDEPGTSSPLTTVQLDSLATQVSNEAQLGSFDLIVNASVLSVNVIEATPPVTSPEWGQTSDSDVITREMRPAGQMSMVDRPVPLKEGRPFSSQARLRVLDKLGQPISILGATASPWTVEATLVKGTGSHPQAVLEGNTTLSFVDGWANFTQLSISHMGENYTIQFRVTYPPEAANFTVTTGPLSVLGRAVNARMKTQTLEALIGENVTAVLQLEDGDTRELLSDIAWRNHTWTVLPRLKNPGIYRGSISGASTVSFDPSSGEATVTGLTFSNVGRYMISFRVVSSPAGYDFDFNAFVNVMSAAQANMTREVTRQMEVKFDVTYEETEAQTLSLQVANYYADLLQAQSMMISDVTYRRGSVVIVMTLTGTTVSVDNTVLTVCSDIQEGQSFTYNGVTISMSEYLTVDGTTYYGVSCGPTSSGLSAGAIAGIVIGCLLFVAIIVVIVVWWKVCYKPRSSRNLTMTIDEAQKARYMGNTDFPVEDYLFKEKTFDNLRKLAGTPVAPADTTGRNVSTPSLVKVRGSAGQTRVKPHTPPQPQQAVVQQSTGAWLGEQPRLERSPTPVLVSIRGPASLDGRSPTPESRDSRSRCNTPVTPLCPVDNDRNFLYPD